MRDRNTRALQILYAFEGFLRGEGSVDIAIQKIKDRGMAWLVGFRGVCAWCGRVPY